MGRGQHKRDHGGAIFGGINPIAIFPRPLARHLAIVAVSSDLSYPAVDGDGHKFGSGRLCGIDRHSGVLASRLVWDFAFGLHTSDKSNHGEWGLGND